MNMLYMGSVLLYADHSWKIKFIKSVSNYVVVPATINSKHYHKEQWTKALWELAAGCRRSRVVFKLYHDSGKISLHAAHESIFIDSRRN